MMMCELINREPKFLKIKHTMVYTTIFLVIEVNRAAW